MSDKKLKFIDYSFIKTSSLLSNIIYYIIIVRNELNLTRLYILKQYLIIERYIKQHVVVVVCETKLTCDIDD